jgi:multidrug transporter EmrE-like cation transporter
VTVPGAAERAMTVQILGLVLFSVACSAVAQVMLKHGMAQPAVQQALGSGRALAVLPAVLSGAAVPAGLALYGLGALVWLLVLARLDVSVAYPFVALGFVVTMVLGCLLFGEALTLRKLLGTAAVMAGVWLVAGSR